MAFRFTLAAVLRVRDGLARREEARLQAANQDCMQARAALDTCRAEHLAFRRQNAEALRAGGSGAELEFVTACQRNFARREEALEQRRAELEAVRKEREAAYLRARRDLMAIETLRDEQRAAYEAEQARRAQAAQDELFAMRARHGRSA